MTGPPDHLQQLSLVLCLALSQQARAVADIAHTLQRENQAFQISQTPWDAGRVARTLRYLQKQAGAAAQSFEAAAKSGGVDVSPDG